MVFLVVVLFTVSAVASRIDNTVSEEPFVVHHECDGETFCHVKPDNYPQEEIDRIVMKHLPHLHRMKRDALLPSPRVDDTDNNCAVKNISEIKPFTLIEKDLVPRLILQSNWFEQKVQKVICSSEGKDCFQSLSFNFGDRKARCNSKKLVSSLVVYNHVSKKPEKATIEIDIDCECVI